MALGSAAETHYHLLVTCDIGILDIMPYEALAARIAEVRRMLSGLFKGVKSTRASEPQS